VKADHDQRREALKREIKQLIIDSLKIATSPRHIEDGAPIFRQPKFELDSLDAVDCSSRCRSATA